MISLAAIAVPAMLDAGTSAAYLQSQWARLYHYGHYVLPNMAVLTCLLHLYTAFRNGNGYFVLIGLMTVGIAPFTWVFMLSTNNELARMDTKNLGKNDLPRVRGLVIKWTWFHLMRSFMPLFGAVLAFSMY